MFRYLLLIVLFSVPVFAVENEQEKINAFKSIVLFQMPLDERPAYVDAILRMDELQKECSTPFEGFVSILKSRDSDTKTYGKQWMRQAMVGNNPTFLKASSWEDWKEIKSEIASWLNDFDVKATHDYRVSEVKTIRFEDGSFASYQIHGLVGKGSFGAVYYATIIEGRGPFEVAVKLPSLDKPGAKPSALTHQIFDNEVRLYQHIRKAGGHLNMFRYLGEVQGEAAFAIEYFHRLSLLAPAISQMSATNLENAADELASVLKFMKDNGIDNNDFEPNLFVVWKNGQYIVKVGDFGVATIRRPGMEPSKALSNVKQFLQRDFAIKVIQKYDAPPKLQNEGARIIMEALRSIVLRPLVLDRVEQPPELG